ncbi:MAG: hypothetical protein JRJ04_05410 [Deltaproteobacteria bacterium]|nr:hypothetical protein [Deltaproteobacteria bacterium]
MMTGGHILVIRVILGAAFAVFISRFFFKHVNVVSVAGLGIFLVAMAYVLEYFRNRK